MNPLEITIPQSETRDGKTEGFGGQWIIWLPVILAFVLRVLWLGIKPPHFDEGVNGWFVDQMVKSGFYHYDPTNYHGPFHFYVLFLMQNLFGRHVEVLRMPLIVINTATVWLVMQFRRFIPVRACFFAALAFAVSPGMMFYSRYAIHESWLVFGMILAVWGAAEMWTRGTAKGLWSVFMGITLMILVKETFIIHIVAFLLAAGTLFVLEKITASGSDFPLKPVKQQWSPWAILEGFAVSTLLLAFFFSGGFLDCHGAAGRFFDAFAAWAKTGHEGHGHEKPWPYWLQLIGIYEWPAAVGLLYCLRSLLPGMNRVTRYLAIYGCGTLVGYSIVHYKTPWCIVSIIWPFLFLFGDAVDSFMSWAAKVQKRSLATGATVVASILLLANMGYSARLNYWRPTDPEEKYVYVQTLNDLFALTKPLNEVTARDSRAYHMEGHVILSSYHPLPWILGDFDNIGFYDKEMMPSTMDAGFLIVGESHITQVEAQLQQRYFVAPFHLRDAMEPGRLYLSEKWFQQAFPGRKPEFDPQAPAVESEAVRAEPVEKAVKEETQSTSEENSAPTASAQ